ncbi:MAG: hypothetical protein QXJ17_02150 [Nitrososphaeria archaeon]
MKRRGQSATIAIVFIALMFISAFTTLYSQVESFREEAKSEEIKMKDQLDKIREKINCSISGRTLLIENEWVKYTKINYIILFNENNLVKQVLNVNITLAPRNLMKIQLDNITDSVAVITTLGNIFPAQKESRVNELPNNCFGGMNEQGGTIPVRIFVNPNNTTTFFVVEGLNTLYHFHSNGTKIGTYHLDAYYYVADIPYHSWGFKLAPAYPMANHSGWTGYRIVSLEKGYGVGEFHDLCFLFEDWILSPADKIGTQNTTAYSLETSVPLNFVVQSKSGNRVLGVSASNYGGKTAYVMHGVYDVQTSTFKVYRTNVTMYASYTGSKYYVWSYDYPYFVTRIYGTNPDTITVYKFINDSRAVKLFSTRYSDYTSYFVGDGFFYSYNTTYNGLIIGAKSLQTLQWKTVNISYRPTAFKNTDYGLIFIKLNGFEIYNPDLTISKRVTFPNTTWYNPLAAYQSEYISDGGDWGYEYFPYQFAILDENTIIALIKNKYGMAELVKVDI